MPVIKNVNQQGMLKVATTARTRKAPGTRVGTIQDWRVGVEKSGRISSALGKTIRDGR